MMKYLPLACLLLKLCSVDAQDVLLGLHTGLGTYGMNELSTFNDYYMRTLPFDAVPVDEFPPWFFYKTTFGGSWEKFETGLSLTSYSTGSRYALEDFSGSYQFDNRIKAFGPGIWFNLCLKPQWKIRVLFSNEISLMSTTLKFDESLFVYEEEIVKESYRLLAKDVLWEPGLKAQYPLGAFRFECFLTTTLFEIIK